MSYDYLSENELWRKLGRKSERTIKGEISYDDSGTAAILKRECNRYLKREENKKTVSNFGEG